MPAAVSPSPLPEQPRPRRCSRGMPDASHWDMQLPRGTTYAERAEECRVLANVCPEYLRQSYIQLASCIRAARQIWAV